jgi:hypothetical protein
MPQIINRTINDVMNCETGECIAADSFFKQSIDVIHGYRSELQKAILGIREPLFVCFYCKQKIRIRGGVNAIGKSKIETLHFAHLKDSKECHIKTQNNFSKDEVNRMKYNGAKESKLHIELKNKIAECLVLNENNKKEISNVHVEQVIKSAVEKEWKKPDINAIFLSKRIAFELQLSTTWLDVITQRQHFYQEQEIYIFWIFNQFSTSDYIRNLTVNDVIFTNNQNAYVFDEDTYLLSQKEKDLIIKCYFKTYTLSGEKVIENWSQELIRLSDLTFDPITFKVYYHDSNAQKKLIYDEIAENLNRKEKAKEDEIINSLIAAARSEENENGLEISEYYYKQLVDEKRKLIQEKNSAEYSFQLKKSTFKGLISSLKDVNEFVTQSYRFNSNIVIEQDISILKQHLNEIKIEESKVNEIKKRWKNINSFELVTIRETEFSVIPHNNYWEFIQQNYKSVKVSAIENEKDLFSDLEVKDILNEHQLSLLKYSKHVQFLYDFSPIINNYKSQIEIINKRITAIQKLLSEKFKVIQYAVKSHYLKELKTLRDKLPEKEIELTDIEFELIDKLRTVNYFRNELGLPEKVE